MCFENDNYDWTASVVHDRTESTGAARCCDCGQQIPDGTERRVVEMWQHEYCEACVEWDEFHFEACPDDDVSDVTFCVDGGDHDFGEHWIGRVCLECQRIRAAVIKLETAEGCPEHAREPGLEELRDAFTEHYDAEKYVRAVVTDCPDLLNHPIVVAGLRTVVHDFCKAWRRTESAA